MNILDFGSRQENNIASVKVGFLGRMIKNRLIASHRSPGKMI
ncbi:hypothetical protein CBM2587_A170054 [Cupriavidus taiwanensis]|uniref:Uncharacterized protein n=1 Tax=Cupriavidus taiwanensis TaxID=164546 RepID=A0A976A037_9BURK|nr:hypothetical protein CBM2587_A170054 [Cupriavidus taiwanensis]